MSTLKFTFGMTSKSEFKLNCLQKYIDKYGMKCEFTEYENSDTPQPVSIKNTFICATKRLSVENKNHRFLISIENGIIVSDDIIQEICAIIIKDTLTGKLFNNKSQIMDTAIIIPNGHKFYQKLVKYESKSGLGLDIKINEVIAKFYKNPEYAFDWSKTLCGISKSELINKALNTLWDDFMRETLISKLRFVTGILPKGIAYQDYMSSMYTYTTRKFMTELLIKKIPEDIKSKIDMICGPEFKGHCLAQGIADELKVGLFPLRLEGNLLPPTVKMEHSKKNRYEHTLEIDTHEYNPLVSKKGIKVLLVDYIRDTGESIKKMIELIESVGAEVIFWVTVSSVHHHKNIAHNILGKYKGSIVFDENENINNNNNTNTNNNPNQSSEDNKSNN